MAKISYQSIPSGFDISYAKMLSASERFSIPSVRRKVLFSTRRTKKGLTQKSLITTLQPVWSAFSTEQKDAWNSAAVASGLTGFNLFLKDTVLRIKNEIAGYATPNDIFQALVGRIEIEEPATGAKIGQLHPSSYWVQKKVVGTKSQFEPVLVTEPFSLPLSISISYKTALTACGPYPLARFFCIVFSHYQGRVVQNFAEILFPLSHAWERLTASISSVIGVARGYTVFIEVVNARGNLFFDDVVLSHGVHNWARDPFCNDINQGFTKAFFQIPKNWYAEDVPEGAFFESFYYNGE